MKNSIPLAVLLCAAAPFLSPAASPGPAVQTNAAAAKPRINTESLFTNTIIAKGVGVSVSRTELDDELIRIRATLAGQGRSLPDGAERDVLDSLVSRQLLLARTSEADRAKGKEQFETSLQKFKTNGKLSDEDFNQKLDQQLKIMGMTRRQWEQQSIDQATIPIVLERELKITVTDDQVKKFYEENPARFEQPEMVRAAHILLSTKDPNDPTPNPAMKRDLTAEQKAAKKKLGEDLLKRARAGEDFAKLAKEYSEDPGSKDSGGEYTFARGRMVPEFEAAAFSMNTNQVSDIVTTSYGFHIIKLYEKIPAKKAELEKVTPDIRQYLKEMEIQKLFQDYIQKLRTEAKVEILDEKLKAMEPTTGPVPARPAGSAAPSSK